MNLNTWDIPNPSKTITSKKFISLIKIMGIVFLILPFLFLFLPWQQNVTAYGKVTAYSPNNRIQSIDSPINGMPLKWHVKEGDLVKKGDLLLELSDPDDNYLNKLESQKNNIEEKSQAKLNELNSYELQKNNLIEARNSKILTAEFKADVAKQKQLSSQQSVISAKATLDAAINQKERLERLNNDGLISKRDLEIAERDAIIAQRNLDSANASLNLAIAEVNAANSEIKQIKSDTAAYLNSINATINKIKSESLDNQNSLVSADISISRQKNQNIYAPISGYVFRIPINSSSRIVKQGDSLLSIVPLLSHNDRAVELLVDGRDAPLIIKNTTVRLEFEGWPAIQVPGWSKIGYGTFEAKIAFVDPIDNGSGSFRVLAIPYDNKPWPDNRFLRQGVSVKSWILLNKVSIGYEIWRLLNGFPPIIPEENPNSSLKKS